MSDLAVIDVSTTTEPPAGKSFAVVGPFRERDAGSDATVSALINAMPGTPDVIAGPATGAQARSVIDVRDRKRISRSITDVEAIIVLAPTFAIDPASSLQLAYLASRAKLRGQIVAFVGAGAERSHGSISRWLTRTAVHNADLTILRDELSADALVAAGVDPPLRIGADPAWVELGELFAAPDQKDRLVVALDDHDGHADVTQLARVLAPVAASGFEVVLQPWRKHNHPSGPFAEVIADRIGNNVSVIEPPETLRDARDFYSTSRAVFALRYHAVMAAASAGTSTVVFGGRAMKQLGATLDVPVVSPEETPENVSTLLLKTLERGQVGSCVVPQIIDRAKASIDLVRLLISKGEDTSQSANNPLPLYPNPWR